jgi:hypothetical protein
LTSTNKRHNRKMLSIRAKVEHVFRVVKRQFGYTEVSYKGIALPVQSWCGDYDSEKEY